MDGYGFSGSVVARPENLTGPQRDRLVKLGRGMAAGSQTVRETVDVAVAGGMIREPVAPEAVFTPDLLAEINTFDRAGVAARAKTCDLPALTRG